MAQIKKLLNQIVKLEKKQESKITRQLQWLMQYKF